MSRGGSSVVGDAVRQGKRPSNPKVYDNKRKPFSGGAKKTESILDCTTKEVADYSRHLFSPGRQPSTIEAIDQLLQSFKQAGAT